MPSLTYGVRFGTPKIRWVFVSFSVKRSGTSPSQYEVALAELGRRRPGRRWPPWPADLLEDRPVGGAVPGPQVAEPERRQDVELGRLGAAVVDADPDEDVLGRLLGILDEHVQVAILIEDARVEQLVLELVPAPAPAGLDQVGVGERRLRVLVEVLHVRVGRRAVEVEVVLLDVLAVIALAVGQAEEALLEDRVLAVPQGQGEAKPLLVVGDAGQAVLPPAVGARAGLVVGEVVPGVAALAVVLAHRAPLALAEVGPPRLPGYGSLPSLFEAKVFCRHGCGRLGLGW